MRLGISDAELDHAQSVVEHEIYGNMVDHVIKQRVEFIDDFNTYFHTFIKDEGKLTDMSSEKLIEVLNGYITQHPDGEVRAVLQETKGIIGKLAGKERKASSIEEAPAAGVSSKPGPSVHSEMERLKGKLIEMGAISEELPGRKKRKMAKNPLPVAFFGEALTAEKCAEVKFATAGEGILRILQNAAAKRLSGGFLEAGHEGKRMPRINFLPEANDPDGRYAIAFEGKGYPHKPVDYPDKWVPLQLFTENEEQSVWVLANVHSLGRLGLTPKEIAQAEIENKLTEVVMSRMTKIEFFNADFHREVKSVIPTNILEKLNKLLTIAKGDPERELIAHPDPQVQEAIESAIQDAEKSIKERAKQASMEKMEVEGEGEVLKFEPRVAQNNTSLTVEKTKEIMNNLKARLIALDALSRE